MSEVNVRLKVDKDTHAVAKLIATKGTLDIDKVYLYLIQKGLAAEGYDPKNLPAGASMQILSLKKK